MSEETKLDDFIESGASIGSDEFVQTAAGRIPADWSTINVEQICELRNGEATDHVEIGEESYLVYGSNGPIGSYSESNFDGGLIFGRVGAVGEVERVTEPVWVSDNAIQADVSGDVNTDFLYYYLTDEELGALATKTAQPLLNQSTIGNVTVPTPPIEEQRKIATVLYTVDQAIQKTEEIIGQVQRLRTGIMQDLFSGGTWNHDEFQETQYGTIPAEWGVKAITDIANRIGSGGTPNTDEDAYYGGDIAWVKTDDLNSGLVETTKTKITERGLGESAAKLFPEGTVVFAMYGGALGQNGRLGMEAAMNQACCGIVTDESEIDPYLLHQQLIHREQQLTALSAGTHQQNISQSMIEKFEVFVPPLKEQSEMVEILRDIEMAIIKNGSQKDQLQRLKQGLMQDLLSGTVRTTNTNIEVPDEIAQYG